MNPTLIYSSITGNTRKVARAVMDAMPAGTSMYRVRSAPDPGPFDLLALGFWVDKGGPDTDMAAYMERLQNKTVILFGTLGARPDSLHGRQVIEQAGKLLGGNRILGSFLCRGRIAPELLNEMTRMAATRDRSHAMTPERVARIKKAQSHPDAQDLHNARIAIRGMLAGLSDTPTT